MGGSGDKAFATRLYVQWINPFPWPHLCNGYASDDVLAAHEVVSHAQHSLSGVAVAPNAVDKIVLSAASRVGARSEKEARKLK